MLEHLLSQLDISLRVRVTFNEGRLRDQHDPDITLCTGATDATIAHRDAYNPLLEQLEQMHQTVANVESTCQCSNSMA